MSHCNKSHSACSIPPRSMCFRRGSSDMGCRSRPLRSPGSRTTRGPPCNRCRLWSTPDCGYRPPVHIDPACNCRRRHSSSARCCKSRSRDRMSQPCRGRRRRKRSGSGTPPCLDHTSRPCSYPRRRSSWGHRGIQKQRFVLRAATRRTRPVRCMGIRRRSRRVPSHSMEGQWPQPHCQTHSRYTRVVVDRRRLRPAYTPTKRLGR